MEKEDIQSLLTDVSGKFGFVRKSQHWYRYGEHVVLALKVQKSRAANAVYLNFGLYFPALASPRKKSPTENDWHLFGRCDHDGGFTGSNTVSKWISLDMDGAGVRAFLHKLENVFFPTLLDIAAMEYLASTTRSVLLGMRIWPRGAGYEEIFTYVKTVIESEKYPP
jgi:hypothetical protein